MATCIRRDSCVLVMGHYGPCRWKALDMDTKVFGFKVVNDSTMPEDTWTLRPASNIIYQPTFDVDDGDVDDGVVDDVHFLPDYEFGPERDVLKLRGIILDTINLMRRAADLGARLRKALVDLGHDSMGEEFGIIWRAVDELEEEIVNMRAYMKGVK